MRATGCAAMMRIGGASAQGDADLKGSAGPLAPQSAASLPIRSIQRQVLRDLALPSIAVREQALLVVVELFARLCRELEVRPLDDGVDRTRLLAQTAINALHHVDVVARGAARAVVAARA